MADIGVPANAANSSFPAAAVVSGGLGLLGLGSNMASNHQAQKNFREQMNFAKYQYEDQKKYNSMQSQVARMRAAGINPALAIGSGQLGTAGSSVGSPSSPSFNPIDGAAVGSSVAAGLDADATKHLQDVQAQKISVETLTQLARDLADLYNKRANTKLTEKDSQRLDQVIKGLEFAVTHQEETYTNEQNRIKAETDNYKADERYKKSLAAYKDLEAMYIPAEKKAAIENVKALTRKAYADAISNRMSAEAARESAKAAMRNAMKDDGIFFNDTPVGRQQRNDFIEAYIDATEARSYVQESNSASGGFHAGAKGLIEAGGNSSRSQSKAVKVHSTKGRVRVVRQ